MQPLVHLCLRLRLCSCRQSPVPVPTLKCLLSAAGSLADFIEEDEEDDDGDGGSSDDDDPVPAALEALRSSLGDGDRCVMHLPRQWAHCAFGGLATS